MRAYHRKRNAGTLWLLILLAIAYVGLLRVLVTLTGSDVADGAIGVLLGLYIAAHPAANAVDALFYERASLRQSHMTGSGEGWRAGRWRGLGWWTLNMLAMLAGLVVTTVGATRFAARVV